MKDVLPLASICHLSVEVVNLILFALKEPSQVLMLVSKLVKRPLVVFDLLTSSSYFILVILYEIF